ncbi:MAG TPA: neutral zinc metallopeptidase [Pyrinomonadaceae bacterium]|nr:neutral zinc metallopeptidase [Pyrinomonadaceae bacterium]
MRWRDYGQSSNVEDRRGMGGRGLAIGGGGLGVVVLLLAALICGVDPRQLLENMPQDTRTQQPSTASNQANKPPDENRQFVGAIMKMTEDIWGEILPQQAKMRYRQPSLVLYDGQTPSACGYGEAAMGPFYCPGDQKLYLDFAFFRELQQEFKAPGDFAQAYVIAHEVGHHVQNMLGTMDRLQRSGQGNRGSVALELQADCYAGVWAHYAQQKGLVEAGDAEEAIRAAQSVGDDTIQRRTQGVVMPDSFTHGSSQQRMQWFARGMQSGDIRQCETFR